MQEIEIEEKEGKKLFYITSMKSNTNKTHEVHGVVSYCSDWVTRGCGWKREHAATEVGILPEVQDQPRFRGVSALWTPVHVQGLWPLRQVLFDM